MWKVWDRYIFAEWLKIFGVAIGVTLGILILESVYNKLGGMIDDGATTAEILKYYLYYLPTVVPVVLPISLLLSLIYVLGLLHRNNEIIAMRAAGANIFRITRALWFGGVALSALLFWLNAEIIPSCKALSRTIADNIELKHEIASSRSAENVGNIPQLCFNNRAANRLWFTNSYNRPMKRAKGVRVSVMDAAGRETSRVMAREGVFDDVDMCWFFTDGQEIEFDPSTHRTLKAKGFDKKYFKNFTENPQIMALTMRKVSDLSLFETRDILASFDNVNAPEARPYMVRWYTILASPLSCIIMVAIAIPFSVAGVRINPMVGVSKTVGLFFAYFILDSLFTALGNRAVIPPLAAAVSPALLVLAFALSLYRKVV